MTKEQEIKEQEKYPGSIFDKLGVHRD